MSAASKVLDGPVGTVLEQQGLKAWPPDDWDAVRAIHEEHVQAGAEIVRTASFRATDEATFHKALEAADMGVPIVAAFGPIGDCYSLQPPRDMRLHEQQAQWASDAGALAVLFETLSTVEEAALPSCDLPVWAGVVCGPDGRLLDGRPVDAWLAGARADTVLLTCTGQAGIRRAWPRFAEDGRPWGMTINRSGPPAFDDPMDTEDLIRLVQEVPAPLVGTCCGWPTSATAAVTRTRRSTPPR